ncbi:hypothetical protein HAX54_002144 [Datura stramonium]|uniref:Uncharacterized protein n=1 Tax=Datura stramonium TaxID=4076 RepID=A0ABS8T3H2_DATST|nr:hypothetical protein [Datura stramonium]
MKKGTWRYLKKLLHSVVHVKNLDLGYVLNGASSNIVNVITLDNLITKLLGTKALYFHESRTIWLDSGRRLKQVLLNKFGEEMQKKIMATEDRLSDLLDSS